ncbi:MAG: hypothetical protein H8E25_08855 [Planctomycetes bacterium]|nr:hypothetical protein [Planctomycetota bacterium]
MSSHQRTWTLLIPALAAILLYAHTFTADFVYDDRALLELNPPFQSLEIIPKAFVTPFWELVDTDKYAAGFYRPLAATTFAASWAISDGDPRFFHLLSILLNAATAVAVSLLCIALGWKRSIACMAGTFFAVLGAHAEAVAWVSSQPDIFSALFTILGLRYFVVEREYRGPLMFFIALLFKEASLAIVVLCLISAIMQGRKFWPLLITLGAYYLLRVNAFDAWAAGFDRVNTHHQLEQLEQIALSLKLLGQNIGFIAVPFGHAPFHPMQLNQNLLAPHNFFPAIGAVLAVLVAIAIWRRRSPDSASLKVGLGLMFFGLAPVLNTSAMGQYPFAERFSYLASAGFVILFTIAITRMKYRDLAYLITVLMVSGNIYSSYSGSKNWRTEADLFRWSQQVSPNAMTGHVEFGRLMLETAQKESDPPRRIAFAELALNAFNLSDAINVDKYLVTSVERYKANVGKADALFFLDEIDNAKQVYQMAIEHYVIAPEAYLGVGNCTSKQAFAYWSQSKNVVAKNHYSAAIHAFNSALQQKPNMEEAVAGKAKALVQLINIEGIESPRFAEALSSSEIALNFYPNDFSLLLNLVALYDVTAQKSSAILALEGFIERNPQHPETTVLKQLLFEFSKR